MIDRIVKIGSRGGPLRALVPASITLGVLVVVTAVAPPIWGQFHPLPDHRVARPATPTKLTAPTVDRRTSVAPPGAAYPSPLAPGPALFHGPDFLQSVQRAPSVTAGPSADGNTSAAQGIDVAAYQHAQAPIDWGLVASQYQFVYIKATEGDYYTNPYYPSDYWAATGQGMLVGGYEFATPNDTSGTAEADYFLSQSGYAWGAHLLMPMVDLENDPYDGSTPCYGLSQQGMVSWIAAYSAEIEAHLGHAPVIYTDAGWWDQCTGDSSAFQADPLWTASWGVSSPGYPSGFPLWSIWQYATGTVAGVSGPCDVDQFAGDPSALDSKLTTDTNGELASAGPADASPAAGRLDTFVRGTDGAIWDAVTVGGATTDTELGGGIASGTSPAVASWGPGRMDVFIEGLDHQLWHDAWEGAWTGWSPLGGYLTSSPSVSSWGPGRLDVFVAGADEAVWHLAFAGGWWPWESLGGAVAPGTGPAATSWGPGRIDFFLTGIDHQLWHGWYSEGWGRYEPLGGLLTSGPGAASWGSGRLDVFAAGTDYQLWHLPYAASWYAWEPQGGILDSGPGAASEGPGNLEVVVKGIDDGIYLTRFSSAWSGYQVIPGTIGD